MEYTYDDIITAKDILTGKVKEADILGKSGWFMDCIPQDMSLNVIARIGTFSKLISINLDVNYPFDSEDEYCYIHFLPEKKVLAPIPRFKIGDRVKIVKEWAGFGEGYNPTIGKTGRIEEIDEGEIVKVVLDSDGDFWWYRPDSVELIEDEEPEICGSAIEEGPFKCKEKSYKERQAEWVKANNIKEGVKVKIFRKAASYEDGWIDIWLGDADVGKIGVINGIQPNNIKVKTNTSSYWYPYFVLEKVEDEPEYIPYNLSKPEDRDALRDKWVKSTNPDVFHEFKITQFVRMNDDYQTIYVKTSTSRYSGNDLFYDYVFADGSPVGKPANGRQIRQDIALKRISPESGADSRQCSK